MNVMAKKAMAEGAYLFFILVCLAEIVQNLCIVYNPLRDTSDDGGHSRSRSAIISGSTPVDFILIWLFLMKKQIVDPTMPPDLDQHWLFM